MGSEKKIIARLGQQIIQRQKEKLEKEKLAREEERRLVEMANPSIFFSVKPQKPLKLKWVRKRLSIARKKRRELLNTYLEIEHQARKKKMALEQEEDAKKLQKKTHKENILPEILETYLARRPKV